MKLTFLYCEGSHDLAFLSKLISTFTITNKAIGKVADLPKIIQDIISRAIKKIENDNLRIDKPLNIFFPNKVFTMDNDQYLCVFSMGGKDKLQAALENIKMSKLLIGRESSTSVELVRHLFVLDADYILLTNGEINPAGGIENTLSNLSQSIKTVVNDFEDFQQSTEWKETSHGNIGNFIFTNEGKKEGTLEDLLNQFLKTPNIKQASDALKDAIVEFDATNNHHAKDITKQQKIILTSMTQAFHPGSSLAVGLLNEKLVDTTLIRNHQITKDFENFIKI